MCSNSSSITTYMLEGNTSARIHRISHNKWFLFQRTHPQATEFVPLHFWINLFVKIKEKCAMEHKESIIKYKVQTFTITSVSLKIGGA